MTTRGFPMSRVLAGWVAVAILLAIGTAFFVVSGGNQRTDTIGPSTF
jgi:hypothetical protein